MGMEKLAQYIEQNHGGSWRAFAIAAGVSPSGLHGIKKGRNNLTLAIAAKIVDATSEAVTFWDLVK